MRLIDADALKFSCGINEDGIVYVPLRDIVTAQTIDAEPVRHGHWIIHVDELFPADSTQECSACHGEEWLGIKRENYCPHCGAKMDEKVNT